MDLAVKGVEDGGTVHIVDTYTPASSAERLGYFGKTVTLTGGTLDLSKAKTVGLRGAVTLSGVTVAANNNTVYANGKPLVIQPTVTFSGTVNELYGGKDGGSVSGGTDLKVYAGTYNNIYGGSKGGEINGDVHLLVGGTVNSDIDVSDHTKTQNAVYGGSNDGKIVGDVHLEITGNAQQGYTHGGGYGANSVVTGTCYSVIGGGNIMSCYGGSRAGRVGGVNFQMKNGTVEQILGGNWYQNSGNHLITPNAGNLVGDVDITLSGGTVTRRVYGGCYNDYDVFDGWVSDYFVQGHVRLTIQSGVNFRLSDVDKGILAVSRCSANKAAEISEMYIESQTLYSALESKIGSSSFSIDAYDDLYVQGVKQ